MFTLEQWAQLTREALDDAGIDPAEVDGICATNIRESDSFVPSTIAEYLGMEVNFAEVVDLGGASCAAMVWRAAAAIELGIANVVVIAAPSCPGPAAGSISRIRSRTQAAAPAPPGGMPAPASPSWKGSQSGRPEQWERRCRAATRWHHAGAPASRTSATGRSRSRTPRVARRWTVIAVASLVSDATS